MQYAAARNVEALDNAGVHISMAEVGQPTQNPHAKRFIRTTKEEVYLSKYENYKRRTGRSGKSSRTCTCTGGATRHAAISLPRSTGCSGGASGPPKRSMLSKNHRFCISFGVALQTVQ